MKLTALKRVFDIRLPTPNSSIVPIWYIIGAVIYKKN